MAIRTAIISPNIDWTICLVKRCCTRIFYDAQTNKANLVKKTSNNFVYTVDILS